MDIIKTNKPTNTSDGESSCKKAPLFRMTNYILMIVGAVLLFIGYLCLSGGAVEDPNTFDGEIFNTRRTVTAPVLLFLGLCTEIVAIMWHPHQKKQQDIQ